VKEPLQSSQHIMLIRPAAFTDNPQTRASNVFQQGGGSADQTVGHRAMREFDGLVDTLQAAGIEPIVFADLPGGAGPDAVFPNNWLSTHADGTVVLYPLLAPNRRPERRPELIQSLVREYGFVVNRVIDLSPLEQRALFLEGTGSLVLDRPSQVAYAALSPRTSPGALAEFAALTAYRVVSFGSSIAGQAVYHTNVIISAGSGYALLCADAITEPRERRLVAETLEASGQRVIPVSLAQAQCFACNSLELVSAAGPVLLMSAGAAAELQPSQRALIEQYARLLPASVPTIERYGGGSVRCMLAEIHLPRQERKEQRQ